MGEIAIRRAVAGDAERLNDALRRLSEDIGDSHAGTPALLARAGFAVEQDRCVVLRNAPHLLAQPLVHRGGGEACRPAVPPQSGTPTIRPWSR